MLEYQQSDSLVMVVLSILLFFSFLPFFLTTSQPDIKADEQLCSAQMKQYGTNELFVYLHRKTTLSIFQSMHAPITSSGKDEMSTESMSVCACTYVEGDPLISLCYYKVLSYID